MNEETGKELLAELRKLRATARWVLWLIAASVIFGVVSFPFSSRYRPASLVTSWESVQTDMRRQDFPRALAEANALVTKEPNYYYGEAFLGAIHLAMGNVSEAEAHYKRAYDLFPNEESEKNLAAVRKRMTNSAPMKLLSE
jgi:cytochrome c-type biogenesis protein CcmH/NrfG